MLIITRLNSATGDSHFIHSWTLLAVVYWWWAVKKINAEHNILCIYSGTNFSVGAKIYSRTDMWCFYLFGYIFHVRSSHFALILCITGAENTLRNGWCLCRKTHWFEKCLLLFDQLISWWCGLVQKVMEGKREELFKGPWKPSEQEATSERAISDS